QVLLNLVSNSIKYNRPGGSVEIQCAPAAGNVIRISVRDEGVGIAPEKLLRLYTPFDRLGAETGAVEGSGLGLVLSKRLIEAMHGSISVESQVGKGSTFSIELPIAQKHAASEVDSSIEVPSFTGSDMHSGQILYIEDNPSNTILMERVLQYRKGMRLVPAALGRLGLELAEAQKPDVILLDLHLPDITGWDVLQRLKQNPATANIPVVIISADATETQVERLMNIGADEYLTKPFDVARLLEVLDRYMQRV
ncbi:MAG: response regulator, partial [Blastocatellia bacterium]|nr:response regulator [Blastocatellia bacterium]